MVYNNDDIKTQFFGLLVQSLGISNIYIVFRGTVPSMISNWIANLNFEKKDYPNSKCDSCQVHSGFYDDYQLLKSNVQEFILNVTKLAPNDKYVLHFVGHSLGGAFATLVAVQNKVLRPSWAINLYTYGQPRVGNDNFAKFVSQMTSKTQRVIHYADVVPHLPPQIFGYQHYNMEYWYEQLMVDYVICIAQNPNCANSVNLLDYSVDDHDMSWYVKIHKVHPGVSSYSIDNTPIDVYGAFNLEIPISWNLSATFKGSPSQWYDLGGPYYCGYVGGSINNTDSFSRTMSCSTYVKFDKQYTITLRAQSDIRSTPEDESKNQCWGQLRVHIKNNPSSNLKTQNSQIHQKQTQLPIFEAQQ